MRPEGGWAPTQPRRGLPAPSTHLYESSWYTAGRDTPDDEGPRIRCLRPAETLAAAPTTVHGPGITVDPVAERLIDLAYSNPGLGVTITATGRLTTCPDPHRSIAARRNDSLRSAGADQRTAAGLFLSFAQPQVISVHRIFRPANLHSVARRCVRMVRQRMNEDGRTWRDTLARQLADYRRRHGLSQRALARELGLPHSTVTRLEHGEHEPRISTLSVLADFLNRDLSLQIRPGQPVKMPGPRRKR